MIGPAQNRRLASGDRGSRQVELRVGASHVSLAIEGDPTEASAATVEGKLSRAELWAGDAGGSFAQAQGENLWSTVFTGAAGLAFQEAAANAATMGQTLTLRVTPEPNVPRDRWMAPWELLHDRNLGAFLALSAGYSIVRDTLGVTPTRTRPPERTGPLEVLLVPALYLDGSPSEWQLAFTEAQTERQLLLDLAEERPDDLHVRVVDDPSRAQLLDLLATEPVDIVHFIGGGYGGRLVVSDSASDQPLWPPPDAGTWDIARAHLLDADAIAAAMHSNPGLSVVLLNGCDTATVAEGITMLTGATCVGHNGVVADHHATAMSVALHQALLAGLPIDVAFTEIRRTLEQQFPGVASWATTVVFTRWPPLRLVPERDGPTDKVVDLSHDQGAGSFKSLSELHRLIHSTNLTRLSAMPEREWSPIADQIEQARVGAEA